MVGRACWRHCHGAASQLPCAGWGQSSCLCALGLHFLVFSYLNWKLKCKWQTKLGINYVFVCKPGLHNRKDKANPKNNTLPMLSKTPSTSIFQAVQFKRTFEIQEPEIPCQILYRIKGKHFSSVCSSLRHLVPACISLLHIPQTRTFVPKETDASKCLMYLSSWSHQKAELGRNGSR